MLSFRTETFQNQLPNVDRNDFIDVPPRRRQTVLLARCLTNVAIIRLHAPQSRTSVDSNEKARMAAARLVSDINQAEMRDWGSVDPIMGVCTLF